MRNGILAATCGMLLASCGGGDEQAGTVETDDGEVSYDIDQDGEGMDATITGPDGQQAQVRSGPGTEVDLPEGFSVYPGASVMSSTTVNASDGAGTLVLMSTEATAEEVIDYYRQQAEAAGIAISGEANTTGTSVIGGESEDGLALSVSASAAGGDTTMVQLSVGRGNR